MKRYDVKKMGDIIFVLFNVLNVKLDRILHCLFSDYKKEVKKFG
jgi:hypothetical protein